MYYKANAGHIGCSLSCVDLIIGSLILQKSTNESFILSKGHAAVALYVALNHLGEISETELNTFYHEGTVLSAHPAPNQFRGIPFATGSLGHGLPISAGIAQANKLLNNNEFVYVLMSDGETNEGTTWEAAHFAGRGGLDNLIVMIDKNGLQGFGRTNEVLGDTASAQQWELMGFDVVQIDGHDLEMIISTIQQFKERPNGKPKLLIANTVKGKGVSYMENRLEWHYLPMSADLYEQACHEIKQHYPLEQHAMPLEMPM